MNLSRQTLAWLLLVLILGVTSWFGWKALRDSKPAEASGPMGGPPPSTVIVKPAEMREVVDFVEATGTLRAARRSEVAARESSAIEELLVDEGDLVKANAIIARLDGRRLETQLQETQAALTAAEAELAQREAETERAVRDEEMMRGLWDERAVAEREYLDSIREMKVAEARQNAAREAIEAAKKRLELIEVRRGDLEIRAPFDGQVVARHAELGEWLNEGDPVVTLVSTGEVEAWLQLPERHAALLRGTAPSAVEVTIPGSAEAVRADRFSLVPDVDGRSRRFTLIAHISDPENRLTPGSSVRAQVPLGAPAEKLVVPADAILQSFSGAFVFIPQNQEGGPPIAQRVDVRVIFERNGESILEGDALKPGAPVIVEGNERLFPGTPLDPQPWSDTRATSAR